ncbi:hypothetical protein ScalyP_jg10419 [Parmales sp. scaly parma]|nr:hypothetical protein ScalyP_jg10419 [Parmales sp. scaly parma]
MKCYINTVILLLSSLLPPSLLSPPSLVPTSPPWQLSLLSIFLNLHYRHSLKSTSLDASSLYENLGDEHSDLAKGGDAFLFFNKLVNEYANGNGNDNGNGNGNGDNNNTLKDQFLLSSGFCHATVRPPKNLILENALPHPLKEPLPPNLCFKVNRFDFDVHSPNTTPNTTPQQQTISKIADRVSLPKNIIDDRYEFSGAVIHEGGSQTGHNFVLVRRNDMFYKIDDEDVTTFDMGIEANKIIIEANCSLVFYSATAAAVASITNPLPLSLPPLASKILQNIHNQNTLLHRRSAMAKSPPLQIFFAAAFPILKVDLVNVVGLDPSILVGKRLGVKFKDGLYYEGKVGGIVEKKFRVDYDDGTTQRYTLYKKEFKWL